MVDLAAPLRRLPPSTVLRRALWPAMLIGGIAAESFLWRHGQTSPDYVIYDLGIGFLTAFVTLAIWEAKPANPVGPLLFVWAAWFVVSPVRFAHVPAVIAISWPLDGISGVCFAAAMLAYPTGRLPGRADCVMIWSAAVAVVVLRGMQLLWSPLSDIFNGDLCCQTSPPFLGLHADTARMLRTTTTVALCVLLVAFMALLVRRFVRARSRERHLLLPVALVAALFALKTLAETLLPVNVGGRWDAPDIVDHVTTLSVAVVFLLGTYSSRVARAGVADLVAQIGGARPELLEMMLASALRDRDLRLKIGADESDRPPAAHQVVTPIRNEGGELLAQLHHDRSVLDDRRLLSSVVAAVRLALENAHLHAQVLAQLDDVRASRARLIQASDAERRRLERNLHDGAQQRLLSLGLALQLAQQANGESDSETKSLLSDAQNELAAAIGELRELGRGINPAVLADHGLASAVHTLANRCPVPVEVTSVPEQRLAAPVETAAYYVIAEALQNAVKHAGAAHVIVRVDALDDALQIVVADDGTGGAVITPGGGLHGLVDRVEAIDGTLNLRSCAEAGTQLLVRLPCASS